MRRTSASVELGSAGRGSTTCRQRPLWILEPSPPRRGLSTGRTPGPAFLEGAAETAPNPLIKTEVCGQLGHEALPRCLPASVPIFLQPRSELVLSEPLLRRTTRRHLPSGSLLSQRAAPLTSKHPGCNDHGIGALEYPPSCLHAPWCMCELLSTL